MDEDVEKRLEAAKANAERQAEAAEFLQSLKPGDTIAKPVIDPQAYHFRSKLRGAAERGELTRTDCQHPFEYLQQYIDEDPKTTRYRRPVNLFECGVCHLKLWLVDPWGKPKADA